jgi:ribosomal protein S10
VLAENFVVKGTFFRVKSSSEDLEKFLDSIKTMLIEYIKSKGFEYEGPISFIYRHLEISFTRWIHPEKKSFFKRKERFEERYFKTLDSARNDFPWIIRVHLYPGKFKDSDGTFIEITSEPAIFYKIVQRGRKVPTEEKEYSFIVYTNKVFVEGVAKSIGCITVKEPKPIAEFIKTEVSEKLRTFEFNKIADLIEKGRNEIELGKTEYGGLDELRAAIENFFFELVKKLEGTPHSLDKPENNIALLESMGYLDGKTKGLIITTLYNQIYKILSDKTTHKREPANLFDARLYFNLTEQIFDYLLEKIMRYKIKEVKQNASVH